MVGWLHCFWATVRGSITVKGVKEQSRSPQEAERGGDACALWLPPSSLFMPPGSAACGIVLPAFSVGLSPLINLSENILRTPRGVFHGSLRSLDPIKWARLPITSGQLPLTFSDSSGTSSSWKPSQMVG